MELKTVTLSQKRAAARVLYNNLARPLSVQEEETQEWAEDLAADTLKQLFTVLGLITAKTAPKDTGLPLRDQVKDTPHCTVRGVPFVWLKNLPIEQEAFNGLWLCKLCTAIVVDEEIHADDHAAVLYKNDLTRIALTTPILNELPPSMPPSHADFNPNHPKNWI